MLFIYSMDTPFIFRGILLCTLMPWVCDAPLFSHTLEIWLNASRVWLNIFSHTFLYVVEYTIF